MKSAKKQQHCYYSTAFFFEFCDSRCLMNVPSMCSMVFIAIQAFDCSIYIYIYIYPDLGIRFLEFDIFPLCKAQLV